MVLISSLSLFWDARSWPDKVHDAWMLLGLALGLALGWPLAWPWLALGLALGWPGSDWFGSDRFRFRRVPVQTGSVQVVPVRFAAILICEHVRRSEE